MSSKLILRYETIKTVSVNKPGKLPHDIHLEVVPSIPQVVQPPQKNSNCTS